MLENEEEQTATGVPEVSLFFKKDILVFYLPPYLVTVILKAMHHYVQIVSAIRT